MSYTELTAAGHISRVYADESELNTVVFENADATRTAYILSENVKYVGSDGKVYDKSNHLTRCSDGTYKNLKNDITITYPAKITDGITLQYKDIEIVITPQGVNNIPITVPLQTEEIEFTKKQITDTITYTGAFGANTCIEYIQTFTGFKENIYLTSNPASNVFNFTVLTNGASIELRDGIAVLISDGEVVGDFGKVYVYDANGADCYGETVVTTAKPNQLYVLSIVVPTDFLEYPTTQYPVVVDPSVTLRDSTVKIVEDATVFSNYSTNVGSAPYLFIGNYGATYPATNRGMAYVVAKFPLLGTHAGFQQLYNAGKITSVKYNFADVSCNKTNTIRAKRITAGWSESTVTYSTVANYTATTPTAEVTVTAQTATQPYPRYELEILDFIEYYGTSGIANKGIMLEATNTTSNLLTLGPSESGDGEEDDDTLTSSKPYVTYTYYSMPSGQTTGITSGQTFLLINNATGRAISYNTSLSQATPNGADSKQYFTITYMQDGEYRISPANNTSVSLKATSSGLTVATNSTLTDHYWYIVPVDGGYRIHNVASENKVINTNESASTLTASNDKDGSVWTISIKPLSQKVNNTCSAATGAMALYHFGCDTTETALINKQNTVCTKCWNCAYAVTLTINHFLNQNNVGVTYRYIKNSNYSKEGLFALFQRNLENGTPVVMSITIQPNPVSPFNYTTDSHFILITGAFLASDGTAMVVVNDSYDDDYVNNAEYNDPNTYVMTFDTLYSVKKDGGYVICVTQ